MRFFDYLLTVETLAEGKGNAYLGMFNDFITDNAQAKQSVEKYITWARKNLQKNDRIVWFLRWVRVELAGRAKHTDSDAELERLNKRLRTNFSRHDLVPINNLMTNLTHLLGMPIPQMQAIVWQKQSPRELLEELSEIESDWKEANQSSNNLLNYYEGDEPTVIMSFPDGYKWFDLERSTCSAEARAMGHCGNAGGGGTILSLRRLAKSHEGYTYWYPVLTFILHSDGYLGEMKGRNNDKPIEKYHPYIVALLKNYSEIEGIRGGGYLPEHNFAMSDLDPDVAKELKALKPGLADLDDIYRAEGMTKRLIDLIDSRLPSGLSTGRYNKDTKTFIVDEWKDFGHFVQYGVYDDDVEKILDIATGQADFQVDRTDNEPDAFVETVLDMPSHWQERLITRAGMTQPPGSSMDQVVMDAAHQMIRDNDDWYQKFQAVYASEDRIREEAWERLSLYVKAGWSFACMSVYLNIPDEEEKLKAFVANNDNVYLEIGESDIIGYAMANSDAEYDDDQHAWELRQMQGDSYGNASWDTIDDENTKERRREEGLYSNGYGKSYHERNKDEWLAGVDTGTKSLTADFLAVLQGNPIPGRIHDERQNELNFKTESAKLSRLLQLSGL